MEPYGFSNDLKKMAYFKEEVNGVVMVVVKDGKEKPTEDDPAVSWLSLLNGYAKWFRVKRKNANPNPDSPTPNPKEPDQ